MLSVPLKDPVRNLPQILHRKDRIDGIHIIDIRVAQADIQTWGKHDDLGRRGLALEEHLLGQGEHQAAAGGVSYKDDVLR